MRVIVTVQAYDDLDPPGNVIWGFHVEEQVPTEVAADVDFAAVLRSERAPTDDELKAVEEANHRNSGVLLDKLVGHMDAARESVIGQAAAGLPSRGAGDPR
jgi:hypothetical protein